MSAPCIHAHFAWCVTGACAKRVSTHTSARVSFSCPCAWACVATPPTPPPLACPAPPSPHTHTHTHTHTHAHAHAHAHAPAACLPLADPAPLDRLQPTPPGCADGGSQHLGAAGAAVRAARGVARAGRRGHADPGLAARHLSQRLAHLPHGRFGDNDGAASGVAPLRATGAARAAAPRADRGGCGHRARPHAGCLRPRHVAAAQPGAVCAANTGATVGAAAAAGRWLCVHCVLRLVWASKPGGPSCWSSRRSPLPHRVPACHCHDQVVCLRAHGNGRPCSPSHTRSHTSTRACTHTHTHTQPRAHTHAHSHTRMHTHTRIQAPLSSHKTHPIRASSAAPYTRRVHTADPLVLALAPAADRLRTAYPPTAPAQ